MLVGPPIEQEHLGYESQRYLDYLESEQLYCRLEGHPELILKGFWPGDYQKLKRLFDIIDARYYKGPLLSCEYCANVEYLTDEISFSLLLMP